MVGLGDVVISVVVVVGFAVVVGASVVVVVELSVDVLVSFMVVFLQSQGHIHIFFVVVPCVGVDSFVVVEYSVVIFVIGS